VVPPIAVRDVVALDEEFPVLEELKFVRPFELLLFHVPKIERPLWKLQELRDEEVQGALTAFGATPFGDTPLGDRPVGATPFGAAAFGTAPPGATQLWRGIIA